MEFIAKHFDKTTLERVKLTSKIPFKRLPYTEAIDILLKHVEEGKKTFEFAVGVFCAASIVLGCSLTAQLASSLLNCLDSITIIGPKACSDVGGHYVEWGMDLGSKHEHYLAEEVFKGPIIVYDYLKDIKAFCMR
eukprot:TRINITY_DN11174_c0_g1_i2.p1 TRINITY_DN11174_c0_g1~~TRINITY_DN11174_c0_g1_i2.p1  ORF type:complete len:135 (+),score=44.41 TRINITY_DN11174_c0_g1_i2:638-1042(+)